MTGQPKTTGRTARPAPKEEATFTDVMRAAFLRPRLTRDPAAMLHVPLLFWLVRALRPARSLVLGIGQGDLFLALCQALDRLDQMATCTGVGVSRPPGSDVEMVPDLREEIRLLYPDLAELRVADGPGPALKGQRKGSLDLLLVDLTNLEGAVLPDAAELLRPLAADGVLILRGRSDDGGWLQRLTDHSAAIRFRGRPDLVILPQGQALPPTLCPLVHAAPRGELAGDIDRLFRRLGEGLEATARYDQAVAAGETGKPLAALRESHDQRGQLLARVQVELFELRARHARLEGAREAAVKQLAAARAEIDAIRAELGEADSAQEAERDARVRETASLTRELETERKARHAAEQELAIARSRQAAQEQGDCRAISEREAERETRFRETAALTRQLETMRAENARLSARVVELLESTSWRITAPIRSVGDNLRHRKRRRAARKRQVAS